jgi:hypothetical protein
MGNREYFQLVENRWVEGKPRQKVLVHLGRHETVDDALREWPVEIKHLRQFASEGLEEHMFRWEPHLSTSWKRGKIEIPHLNSSPIHRPKVGCSGTQATRGRLQRCRGRGHAFAPVDLLGWVYKVRVSTSYSRRRA